MSLVPHHPPLSCRTSPPQGGRSGVRSTCTNLQVPQGEADRKAADLPLEGDVRQDRGGCDATALALAAVFFLLLLFAFPAFAQNLPTLTGRVVDNAGLIDPATKAALTAKLEAFEKKSSDQIVVATVPTLNGEPIENYANRLFRAWGLGQGGENNGVLLLVAKNDRKMRIEVGYGLEGTLTDLHSKLIIDNTMVPAFRAGDFSGGISGPSTTSSWCWRATRPNWKRAPNAIRSATQRYRSGASSCSS